MLLYNITNICKCDHFSGFKKGRKFESDIDMSLSNSSIGADAPAATFGKTAFADFASVRYKSDEEHIGDVEEG